MYSRIMGDDENEGNCNQRRLIVGCWPDLIEDVHDPDFDSYVKDFHDMFCIA